VESCVEGWRLDQLRRRRGNPVLWPLWSKSGEALLYVLEDFHERHTEAVISFDHFVFWSILFVGCVPA